MRILNGHHDFKSDDLGSVLNFHVTSALEMVSYT